MDRNLLIEDYMITYITMKQRPGSVTLYSSLGKVKQVRAQGGCLGTKSR